MCQCDATIDLKEVDHRELFFHGPVILPYIFNSIWWMNVIVLDNESVWSDIWPKIKCYSELYFTVQWFA